MELGATLFIGTLVCQPEFFLIRLLRVYFSENEALQHAREREASLRAALSPLGPSLAAMPIVSAPTQLTGQVFHQLLSYLPVCILEDVSDDSIDYSGSAELASRLRVCWRESYWLEVDFVHFEIINPHTL